MLALIQFHLVTLIAAMLIGVATGWWAFRHRNMPVSDRQNEESID